MWNFEQTVEKSLQNIGKFGKNLLEIFKDFTKSWKHYMENLQKLLEM